MIVNFTRVRLLGSCILGGLFAILVAYVLSAVAGVKYGTAVFFLPLAILFTVMWEKIWQRARKQDANAMRERYKKGKLPMGRDENVEEPRFNGQ